MKKLTYIALFIVMFAISNGVEAKKADYDCEYTINFSKVHAMATNKTSSFHIIYYDDGSVDSSQLKQWDGTATVGSVYVSDSGFNSSFAQGVKDFGGCPDIAFQFDGDQMINSRVMSLQTGAEEEENFIKADHKEGSAKSETGKKEAPLELVCRKFIKAMRNESSWDVYVSFYRQGDKRIFGTSSSLNGTESRANINGMTTVAGYTYQVSDEMIKDVYENGNCEDDVDKEYKFYLECDNGNGQKVKLVLTKPDDTVNCSYDIYEAPKDDGRDADVNHATKSVTRSSYWTGGDGKTDALLKKIWGMIRVAVPVLIIIFAIADFLKVVFISDEKNYKEAFHRLLIRIAVGVGILVLPALVKLALDLGGLKDVGILKIFS